MNRLRLVIFWVIMITSFPAWAQDPDLDGSPDAGVLVETPLTNEGAEVLLLDNSRSKIGRDFYDAFFRLYANLPPAQPVLLPTDPKAKSDTTQRANTLTDSDINAFVVTIDELPAAGFGTALLSMTLNDQLIWQNYVPLRPDIIELYAQNAAENVQQYIQNFQDLQRQLDSEDQRGSGIY